MSLHIGDYDAGDWVGEVRTAWEPGLLMRIKTAAIAKTIQEAYNNHRGIQLATPVP